MPFPQGIAQEVPKKEVKFLTIAEQLRFSDVFIGCKFNHFRGNR